MAEIELITRTNQFARLDSVPMPTPAVLLQAP
jgi:hypothetical protein